MNTRQQRELEQYCRLSQAAGISLRRALAEYRGTGGRVRTSTFVRAWQDVKRG